MYSMMLTYQQPIYHDLDSWYSFLLDNKLYKIKKITGKAIIQYYAISPAEYQYLRAANAYADHDSSNLLETPVIFPNNIKGGIGIFAIENPTETSIPLKSNRRLLESFATFGSLLNYLSSNEI